MAKRSVKRLPFADRSAPGNCATSCNDVNTCFDEMVGAQQRTLRRRRSGD